MSHNTFGHLFRVTTWGESHGPALGCVVDGCPPGLPLTEADIQPWLDKRRPGTVALRHAAPGAGRGEDPVRRVRGRSHRRPGHHRHADLADDRQRRPALPRTMARSATATGPATPTTPTTPKYGVRDYRGGGRSSARETAARVAAGAVARKVLGDGVHDPRRAGADRRRTRSTAPAGTGTRRSDNPFWCPDAARPRVWEELPRRRRARPAPPSAR